MENETTRFRQIAKLRKECGSALISALEDPQTIEILLNADGNLWQERLGENMRVIGTINADHAEAIIRTVAGCLNTTVSRENPILEGEFPIDGSRFAGQLPPIVMAPIFAIRKRASSIFTLDEYVKAEIMTHEQCELLRVAVRDQKNILQKCSI